MEDIGTVCEGLSKYLKKIYVYQCVRQPGHVLEFALLKGDLYQCVQCRRERKMKAIKIVNDAVVPGKQHPENGHSSSCTPVMEAEVDARQLDRSMRHDVRTTGKRPRDAFTFSNSNNIALISCHSSHVMGKVFCAVSELAILYQSQYIVCDGTFEMCPDSSYQLYTLHGFFEGEAMALAWALLPNKTQATYVELFTAIHDAFVAQFGDAGFFERTFLTDFELSAIQAINKVFPNCRVKGCSFHFRQAVYRRVQQEGLKKEYDMEASPIRGWIRQLLAMTALPAFAVPLVWPWLKEPPSVDLVTNAKAGNLADYFERTWIQGDFPTSLWTHYDNNGPRTTNVAEGYHNGLNSRFGKSHPSLRLFLDWLQKYQFEVQSRGLQLVSGRAPKPRDATYVKLDESLWSAKLAYSMEYGWIFRDYAFNIPAAMYYFHAATYQYLAHVSYLVGCI